MKIFITTVAGLASRFSKSLNRDVLKCTYYERAPMDTLLYRQLMLCREYDRLIVVGGYKFHELESYINRYIPAEVRDKINIVNNTEYEAYGSGWSLYAALKAAHKYNPEEILFAEGDLFFSKSSLCSIIRQQGDILTYNREIIESDKSVVVYFPEDNIPRFIYDTGHGMLSIGTPFRKILNSAQIWKFSDGYRLYKTLETLTDTELQKTNLSVINAYFSGCDANHLNIIPVDNWINCNTINDYRRIEWRSDNEI